MPPIISIVGRSGSGKTTLLEKLIGELSSRGYRVATAKHIHGEMSFDKPHKDTWRHLEAGSQATIAFAKDKMVLVRSSSPDMELEEIAWTFGEDYDIIITEGFKHAGAPKIEVHRREVAPPLQDISKIIAIATDEPLDSYSRQFSLDDIKPLADFIADGFIKPQQERLIVRVNNEPVSLSAFPREFFTNVVLSMVASLKGVGKVKSLDVFLRRAGDKDS